MSSISGHEQVPQRIRRPRKVGARLDLSKTLLSDIFVIFYCCKKNIWCSRQENIETMSTIVSMFYCLLCETEALPDLWDVVQKARENHIAEHSGSVGRVHG